jgi:hypothetical protein
MKKHVFLAIWLAAGAWTLAPAEFSQRASYAGPLLGFGWHDVVIGGQYEYGISRCVGIGAVAGFSWDSYSYYWAKVSYTYFSVGFQCNYHFIQVPKFDLFAGGILGFDIVSSSYDYYYGYYDFHPHNWEAHESGLFLGPQVGANFPVGRNIDIQARLGYPYYLSAGVNFRFGG